MAWTIASPSSRFSFGASNEIPQNSSRFPRLVPQFWPWEKVKLGPLSVSPMGFGTWAWGNQLLWGYQEAMNNELQETFNLAIDNGINLFDTADSYGTGKLNGQSERLLGKFIRDYQGPKGVRDNIIIATKFAAYPWRLTAGQFVKACQSSLKRLQIERIGVGQLHWSTANYAPLQELALWDGLVAMYEKSAMSYLSDSLHVVLWKPQPTGSLLSIEWPVLMDSDDLEDGRFPIVPRITPCFKQSLVRAVGVSNYGPKQLLKISDYLKARGVPLCSAQVQFSLLSMAKDQMELKAVCDSLNICLISYSPLGLGMLTGKYTAFKLPRGPRALLFRQILPGLEPLLRSLGEIADKRGKTIPQVAINWCICKGTVPIPGVKSVRQAEENLGALGWRLSLDEMLQLESAAQESPRKMIQNIFQTR